jgi:hypothetical protein
MHAWPAQELSPEVLRDAEVQRVLAMQQAIESGEWVTFFRLATEAPYLQACLAHMYFPNVRARALGVLASTGARPSACRHPCLRRRPSLNGIPGAPRPLSTLALNRQLSTCLRRCFSWAV